MKRYHHLLAATFLAAACALQPAHAYEYEYNKGKGWGIYTGPEAQLVSEPEEPTAETLYPEPSYEDCRRYGSGWGPEYTMSYVCLLVPKYAHNVVSMIEDNPRVAPVIWQSSVRGLVVGLSPAEAITRLNRHILALLERRHETHLLTFKLPNRME